MDEQRATRPYPSTLNSKCGFPFLPNLTRQNGCEACSFGNFWILGGSELPLCTVDMVVETLDESLCMSPRSPEKIKFFVGIDLAGDACIIRKEDHFLAVTCQRWFVLDVRKHMLLDV